MLDRKLTIPAHNEYQVRGKVKRIVVRSALYDFEVETERGEVVELKEGDNFVLEEAANVLHIKNKTEHENKLVLTLSYTNEGNLESSAGVVNLSGVEAVDGSLKTKLADVEAVDGSLKTKLAGVDTNDGALKTKLADVDANDGALKVKQDLISKLRQMNIGFYGGRSRPYLSKILGVNENRKKIKIKITKQSEAGMGFYLFNKDFYAEAGGLSSRFLVKKNERMEAFWKGTQDDTEKIRRYYRSNDEKITLDNGEWIDIYGKSEFWLCLVGNTNNEIHYKLTIIEEVYV